MPCLYEPDALILPIRGLECKRMQNLTVCKGADRVRDAWVSRWDGRRLLHAAHGHRVQAGPCRIVRSGLRDAAPELGLEVLAIVRFFGGSHYAFIAVAQALAVAFRIAWAKPGGLRVAHKRVASIPEGPQARRNRRRSSTVNLRLRGRPCNAAARGLKGRLSIRAAQQIFAKLARRGTIAPLGRKEPDHI